MRITEIDEDREERYCEVIDKINKLDQNRKGFYKNKLDYNPIIILYYMNLAGEGCFEVETAYNKIVQHIYDT